MDQEIAIQDDPNGKGARHRAALYALDKKQEYLYPVDMLAQDKLVIRNVKYPGSEFDYPDDLNALFRFVSKEYPNAKGGPLYVDEPKNVVEVHRAYERHEKMKQRNLRHVVIEHDSTLEHLLDQLGEL